MSEAAQAPALALEGITRVFRQGDSRIAVLQGAALALEPGEAVALTAPSGAGKSTLLHIAGLLERPSGGEVYLHGRPCGKLSDRERTTLRRKTLGFVYQFHYLLPEFSALENVMLPQMIAGARARAARERARALLASLGLSERESHRPARLSGGEQQRVAIARALANGPSVLLADEPTGNLDETTADAVFRQLTRLIRETGIAALVATHNLDLAKSLDRWLALEGGQIVPHA